MMRLYYLANVAQSQPNTRNLLIRQMRRTVKFIEHLSPLIRSDTEAIIRNGQFHPLLIPKHYDIDDLGKISYNGKEIRNFYVEGLDLTNGKYKQISENLRADAVQNIQVMENHQPIRVLQRKIKTEDVALNLKLRPEFRDRWLINAEGGLGASPFLWKGAADALQISRSSQSAYLYKGNNTGQDVSGEQNTLTESPESRLSEPKVPQFLLQPSFSAPLKKERWLFNHIHSLSANRLYKLNENTQLRINAGYIHDLRTQERGSETTYSIRGHDSSNGAKR